MPQPKPLPEAQRIQLLDSLRGFAILGILLVNIVGFGLPYLAVNDVTVVPDYTRGDLIAWIFTEGVISGTMRALLSMLFGAGILLFIAHQQESGQHRFTGSIFYQRNGWLLLIGLVNAYLFCWFWDILFMYAIVGMLLYRFRNAGAGKLLLAAVFCLLMAEGNDNYSLYQSKALIYQGERLIKKKSLGTALTPGEEDRLLEYNNYTIKTAPQTRRREAAEEMNVTLYHPIDFYQLRARRAAHLQTADFYTFYLWDIGLFMLIGIAFYKMGLMDVKRNLNIYWWMLLVGLGAGALLSYWRTVPVLQHHFNEYELVKHIPLRFYESARLFRSLGFFALLMIMYRSGIFHRFFNLLRPVGRMALSNYLLQSIVCGWFFYGVGLGMFGQLSRMELYMVVLAVSFLQLIGSHLWLNYFIMGPAEWLLRALSYGAQELVRSKQAPGR